VAVALAVGVLALVLVLVLRGGSGTSGKPGARGGGGAVAIRLGAVHDFDPYGDGQEHPEDVAKATDGDPATFWTTETYSSFDKPGVGLVFDAGRPRQLLSLTVASDEPGWTGRIRAGRAASGRFHDVSASRTAASRTVFRIDTDGRAYRYYLLWITDPNGRAHVNEVHAAAAP
jgi:serine/threonine-protein kinase